MKPKDKRNVKCPCCSEAHFLSRCFAFLKLNTSNRVKFIKSKGMCGNCLSLKHNSAECTSLLGCRQGGCNERHNTLLNREQRSFNSYATVPHVQSSENSQQSRSSSPDESDESINCAFSQQSVLLATACILVKNKYEQSIRVNALIDQGSMRSFISKRVVSALGLETNPTYIRI